MRFDLHISFLKFNVVYFIITRNAEEMVPRKQYEEDIVKLRRYIYITEMDLRISDLKNRGFAINDEVTHLPSDFFPHF